MLNRRHNSAFVAVTVIFALFLAGCFKTISSGASQEPRNPIEAALMSNNFAKALSLAQASSDPAAKFYLGRMWQEGWGTDGINTDTIVKLGHSPLLFTLI